MKTWIVSVAVLSFSSWGLGMTVYCSPYVCGDVTGDGCVDCFDFGTVMGFMGELANDNSQRDTRCLDAILNPNGYVDGDDVMGWDWRLSDNDSLNLCAINAVELFMTLPGGPTPETYTAAAGSSYGNVLLIAGKNNDGSGNFSMTDGLYAYDNQTNYLGSPSSPIADRSNGRLTCDADGKVYQINTGIGLVCLTDGIVVVPPCRVATDSDPRYSGQAIVSIGLQKNVTQTGVELGGRPILDAAIDSQGYVYVVPVVVIPLAEPSSYYLAAAKLQLQPEQTPCYSIVRLYDTSPGQGEARDPKHMGLREIELDNSSNVYVTNAYRDDNVTANFLWIYPASGGPATQLDLDNLSGVAGGIADPIGLFASRKDATVYLASGSQDPDDNSTTVYGLSMDNLTLSRSVSITGMGHVTGITEEPTNGNLWIVGLKMENIPAMFNPNQPPFYHPCLASISSTDNSTVPATSLAASGLALPLSVLWLQPNLVRGTVSLDDFAGDNTSVSLTIERRLPGTSTVVETHSPNLDANAGYSFYTVQHGTFDLWIKPSKRLGQVLSNVSIQKVTENGDLGAWITGDCNGDDKITLTDLAIVQAAMDSTPGGNNWNSSADLDGDNETTSTDLAILLGNLTPRGTMGGTVELADYEPGPEGVSVTVDFQRTDQSASPFSTTTTLDSSGQFSLPYYEEGGTYTIGIKASHWLRSAVTGVALSEGPVSLETVSLINGDANHDNAIYAADLNIVLSAIDTTPGMSQWDASADLNGNDNVTVDDLTILLNGMYETSGSAPVMVRLTANVSSIYPGDNFTVTVEVVTATDQVWAVDHLLQVTSEGSGYFTLIDRNLDNSSFPDVIFPNVLVLYPTYATLSPRNGKYLSALVEDTENPVGPGTLLVSTLTIQADAATSPGTYTFLPAALHVSSPSDGQLDNVTVEPATVEVLEGQGQNRMSQNSNLQSQVEVPSLNDVIRSWLMERLGDDYETYDPRHSPAYLSRDDARMVAFLWFLLKNEP